MIRPIGDATSPSADQEPIIEHQSEAAVVQPPESEDAAVLENPAPTLLPLRYMFGFVAGPDGKATCQAIYPKEVPKK